jgi:hypothetical protein
MLFLNDISVTKEAVLEVLDCFSNGNGHSGIQRIISYRAIDDELYLSIQGLSEIALIQNIYNNLREIKNNTESQGVFMQFVECSKNYSDNEYIFSSLATDTSVQYELWFTDRASHTDKQKTQIINIVQQIWSGTTEQVNLINNEDKYNVPTQPVVQAVIQSNGDANSEQNHKEQELDNIINHEDGDSALPQKNMQAGVRINNKPNNESDTPPSTNNVISIELEHLRKEARKNHENRSNGGKKSYSKTSSNRELESIVQKLVLRYAIKHYEQKSEFYDDICDTLIKENKELFKGYSAYEKYLSRDMAWQRTIEDWCRAFIKKNKIKTNIVKTKRKKYGQYGH